MKNRQTSFADMIVLNRRWFRKSIAVSREPELTKPLKCETPENSGVVNTEMLDP